MNRIIFLDTEATGLYTFRGHRPWEIGYIIRDLDSGQPDTKKLFHIKPDLTKADPMALSISGYYERFRGDVRTGAGHYSEKLPGWTKRFKKDIALELAKDLSGAHIFGNVPGFDANMLDVWLRENDAM